MAVPPILWRIRLRAAAGAVAPVEDVLAAECMAVSSFVDDGADAAGAWRVEGIAGAEPDPDALAERLEAVLGPLGLAAPAAAIEPLAPRDWVAENLKDFPPLRRGRYFIHGSHVPAPASSGSIAIRLDAGPAFGSGEHPSTAGCLDALDRLARERRFRRPLDMGCGSGILAIAMAKTWRVPVVAIDIDAGAVAAAARNARLNGVGGLVRAVPGPGYRAPAVRRGGPFDLVCANILTGPLCRMAGDLDRHLARPGIAVLSGFLERDGRRIAARHRPFGLSLVRAVTIDGWRTMVLAR